MFIMSALWKKREEMLDFGVVLEGAYGAGLNINATLHYMPWAAPGINNALINTSQLLQNIVGETLRHSST